LNQNKILGVIPARGGSEGVHRKNIKLLCNKPLIAYTIEEAAKSKLIDKLIISTDDLEIAEISKDYGGNVPFIRPKELASNTARAVGVIKHAVDEMERIDDVIYSQIVYLEPPNPLRVAEDIDNCIDLFLEHKPSSVVSVQEANQFHPILMKKIEKGLLKPLCMDEPEGIPRQQIKPKCYMRNGAVYVFSRENILKGVTYGDHVIPYIMPLERSVCIDDLMDWYVAEAWIKASKNEIKT
jgi:CMP-N-acetylneuraminic acid synthetase